MTLRRAAFSLTKTGVSIAASVGALLCFAAISVGPARAGDPTPRPVGPKTAGTPEADGASAVAARGTAVYVAGFTRGSLDGPAVGNADVFVRKYHEEGDIIWGRQFGTPVNEFARGIAVDASGNVYVGGSTGGSISGNRGSDDAFLRKYNTNGVVLWTRQFGTAVADGIDSVAVDGSGNIYVAGFTAGFLQVANKGSLDAFVRKYSPAGTVLWTRQFGSATHDQAYGVATDSQGNVFVTGITGGAVAGANLGGFDIFLIKFNPSGGLLWQRQFGTSATDIMDINGLAVDSTGAAIVAGQTGGSFPGFTNVGGTDMFIRKYSSAGAVLKTNQAGTVNNEFVAAVARDSTNNFYVVGTTTGSFGGTNAGLNDVFVRKYSSAGNAVWTRQFGTATAESGIGIAAPTSTKIYVVGQTFGALAPTNQGLNDAFVRRLNGNGGAVWTDQ